MAMKLGGGMDDWGRAGKIEDEEDRLFFPPHEPDGAAQFDKELLRERTLH